MVLVLALVVAWQVGWVLDSVKRRGNLEAVATLPLGSPDPSASTNVSFVLAQNPGVMSECTPYSRSIIPMFWLKWTLLERLGAKLHIESLGACLRLPSLEGALTQGRLEQGLVNLDATVSLLNDFMRSGCSRVESASCWG